MILLCYDGSSDAQSAIDHAGELLSGQPATVLTIWEPFVAAMTRTTLSFEEIDAASEQAAHERAQEGVERATRAGMNPPQPRIRVRGATMADTILSEADELDASAIVIGSRGLTGLKSLLLGSVSHALLQHTDRTVIVIPSPEVAAKRAAHRH